MGLAKYLRIGQIVLSVILVLLISMIALSSIGSLVNANIQTGLSSFNSHSMLIRADYRIYNPGPIPLSPLEITLRVYAPDGTPLTSSSTNSIYLSPFSSSSGTLYFNLTLLPGAADKMSMVSQNGQQPVVYAEIASSMSGIVQLKLGLLASNGA